MEKTLRTYSELSSIDSYVGRFRYLALNGVVGARTFGSERYLNQRFYTSTTWRTLRNHIITRDNGWDLGCEGYDIFNRVIIHHLNPMNSRDLIEGDSSILDPEFLITTTHRTHNAIHYGDESLLPAPLVERSPGDTLLW